MALEPVLFFPWTSFRLLGGTGKPAFQERVFSGPEAIIGHRLSKILSGEQTIKKYITRSVCLCEHGYVHIKLCKFTSEHMYTGVCRHTYMHIQEH